MQPIVCLSIFQPCNIFSLNLGSSVCGGHRVNPPSESSSHWESQPQALAWNVPEKWPLATERWAQGKENQVIQIISMTCGFPCSKRLQAEVHPEPRPTFIFILCSFQETSTNNLHHAVCRISCRGWNPKQPWI